MFAQAKTAMLFLFVVLTDSVKNSKVGRTGGGALNLGHEFKVRFLAISPADVEEMEAIP